MRTLLSALACLLLPLGVCAQQAETFGPWEVHYSAINTTLLDPDTASAYGIRRAGGRALLSISLLRTDGDEGPQAHRAEVEVSARNLAGQRREIEMREVVEDDGIYAIGDFRVRDRETLNFSVRVRPEASDRSLEFEFRQEFHTH